MEPGIEGGLSIEIVQGQHRHKLAANCRVCPGDLNEADEIFVMDPVRIGNGGRLFHFFQKCETFWAKIGSRMSFFANFRYFDVIERIASCKA